MSLVLVEDFLRGRIGWVTSSDVVGALGISVKSTLRAAKQLSKFGIIELRLSSYNGNKKKYYFRYVRNIGVCGVCGSMLFKGVCPIHG